VSLLPSAELWVCPNAGHRVPWEQPQAFAARLREFVGAR
jgi:pimeloyl-ACP methyl ester carboxylesterase